MRFEKTEFELHFPRIMPKDENRARFGAFVAARQNAPQGNDALSIFIPISWS